MDRALLEELYCPFTSVISVHADLVEEASTAWADDFGLFRDGGSLKIFKAGGIGRLAARFHPHATRGDLRLLADFYAWMFLQDDLRDDSEVGLRPDRLSESDRRSLDVLEGDEASGGDGSAVHAACDLRERFEARAPGPMWMRRFTRAVRNYFEATVWEASNRARGIVPDPEAYLRMRPLTGGLDIDEELIGLSADARLPRWVLDDASVKRMTEISFNVVCWSNDILSLDKELSHGDFHNLVVVLHTATGLSLEDSARRVVEMHNAEVRDFIEISADPPGFGGNLDVILSRYVAVLESRMRGNLDWSLESGRYKQTVGSRPVV